jgi:hypothetical protein
MINMSVDIQIVLVGITIGLVVYYVMKRMRYRLPPGPWCIPLIGHYKGNNLSNIYDKRLLSKF